MARARAARVWRRSVGPSAPMRLHRGRAVLPVEGRYAVQPCRRSLRDWPSSHSLAARRAVLAVVEDRAHDLVLHLQREVQVGQELADVRAFARGSRRGRWCRRSRRRNPVRRRHRRRRDRPSRSWHSSDAAPSRGRRSTPCGRSPAATCDSMPCSDDSTSSKPFRPNLPLLDHLEDQAVAVVARLDAVDLAVELVLELGDVGEALEARVVRHSSEPPACTWRPPGWRATVSTDPSSR